MIYCEVPIYLASPRGNRNAIALSQFRRTHEAHVHGRLVDARYQLRALRHRRSDAMRTVSFHRALGNR